MNESCEVANSIRDSAKIGRDMLGRLIKLCGDGTFRELMGVQFAKYQEIVDAAESYIEECDEHKVSQSKKERKTAFTALRFNTLIDKSVSHMAEMIVLGNTMGLIEVSRIKKEHKDADARVYTMLDKLRKTEQENMIETLEYV